MATDYRYENLGDERFQYLCQALIARDEPALQCLPTGERDGGRDAMINRPRRRGDFAVFQVKYTRSPETIRDTYTWIASHVATEEPKIRELIRRGLRRYYILTNVAGTAFPERGTIDRVNRLLALTFDIEAVCWWRNDLNRRLDSQNDIKASYPEILNGLDVLSVLISGSALGAAAFRLDQAVRAFLRSTYDGDKDIRFRQIDLRRDLFDLFVDVPLVIRPQSYPEWQRHYKWISVIDRDINLDRSRARRGLTTAEDLYLLDGEPPGLPAGEFLLHRLLSHKMPRLVIEGAPGQGKSTLVQFLCQIHRHRLLHGPDSLPKALMHLERTPLRLPFRIDLRDLAVWLSGGNPFPRLTVTEAPRTVETYLAAAVTHESGGQAFEVADLYHLVSTTAILLVFDGLDEVADIAHRQQIVDEVTAAVHRLQDQGQDVHVIVTTRPSAYANSPGFSQHEFGYCELGPLELAAVMDYARRWARAKDLEDVEQRELVKILAGKLDEPHVRELARNPMQLTILLSLVSTETVALPNARTALYDDYVRLFLNREAEKSALVREFRPLLVDIHRFVAWKLHVDAEAGKSAGRISRAELMTLLADYLRREGYDPALAHTIFQGMVERVVALVQRTEGVYEFEVQPIREYFCGKFLYDTAPESRVGSEEQGTIVDRFDVLARAPYWLNVTRFFAGCFNKGQLPALVMSLSDVLEDPVQGRRSQPRILGAVLLNDYVFQPHQRALRDVVRLVSDPLGLRLVFAERRARRGEMVTLPEACGRDVLTERCREILLCDPPAQHGVEVAGTLGWNRTSRENDDWWLREARARTGKARTRWFWLGAAARVLAKASAEQLVKLVEGEPEELRPRLRALIWGGHEELFTSVGRFAEAGIDAVIDGGYRPPFRWSVGDSPLAALASMVDRPMRAQTVGKELQMRAFGAGPMKLPESMVPVAAAAVEPCIRLASAFREWLQVGRVMLTDASATIEDARSSMGERWGVRRLALGLFGDGGERRRASQSSPGLLEPLAPLLDRIRTAKARGDDVGWWRRELKGARQNVPDVAWVMLCLLVLASKPVVGELAKDLDRLFRSTSDELADMVVCGLESHYWAPFYMSERAAASADRWELPGRLHPITAMVLGCSVVGAARLKAYSQYLTSYTGRNRRVVHFCLSCQFVTAAQEGGGWEKFARAAKAAYGSPDGLIEDLSLRALPDPSGRHVMTSRLAHRVCDEPALYPIELVEIAEGRLGRLAGRHTPSVGGIAAKQNWAGL